MMPDNEDMPQCSGGEVMQQENKHIQQYIRFNYVTEYIL